jgi:uncharacterized protein YndB with AHSA1/START domain
MPFQEAACHIGLLDWVSILQQLTANTCSWDNLAMARVHHRIGVAAPREKVYACLLEPDKLTGWWSSTAEANGNLRLGFAGLTTLEFEIVDNQPPERLLLNCTGQPEIWDQSSLEFRTENAEKQTYLYLTHSKESASDIDFLYFNTKWPLFLVSLKDFVELGSGRPYPNDQRIDHEP